MSMVTVMIEYSRMDKTRLHASQDKLILIHACTLYSVQILCKTLRSYITLHSSPLRYKIKYKLTAYTMINLGVNYIL